MAVGLILFLAMWGVDNARLCERLIFDLSANPSLWNERAKDWAIRDHKVAPECVPDWLDIQLVARLTATMQLLIWGPVVCIAMLVLARSPVMDDWDITWGLEIAFIASLLYAISAEVFLQLGAESARKKALKLLTVKISAQQNLKRPDKVVIKRIEDEIERTRTMRDGAFRPWYELPLLHSFGGLGTLWVVLQYLSGVWGKGTL